MTKTLEEIFELDKKRTQPSTSMEDVAYNLEFIAAAPDMVKHLRRLVIIERNLAYDLDCLNENNEELIADYEEMRIAHDKLFDIAEKQKQQIADYEEALERVSSRESFGVSFTLDKSLAARELIARMEYVQQSLDKYRDTSKENV